MTVVVMGIDALDPELVDPDEHPNLVLEEYAAIDTIDSVSGEPSTHELWPTIITGLTPAEHGLQLDDGVAWENPVIAAGSSLADYVLPDSVQTKIGAWLLNNTSEDAFRVPATYYADNDIETLFDGREAKTIGIPNYVTNPDEEDREHRIRRQMGSLFERDAEAKGGHTSDDPFEFYERCMEMSMVRIALVRRALRAKESELVFGYTSGLDLIGHIAFDHPAMQSHAYDELNDFVGELRADLGPDDELLVISDHGLQGGVHTKEAMVASTAPGLVKKIDSVLDVRSAIAAELDATDHVPDPPAYQTTKESGENTEGEVREQLEDLGYM